MARAAGPHAFGKGLRLRRRAEFLAVQDKGARINADCLLVVWRRNEVGGTRLGLTVSSKVGPAVVRNRIRRHLREFFRKRQAEFPKGVDVVVIARSSASDASQPVLHRAFARALAELKKKVPSR
jgi:ribonuclease P protein component